MKKYIFPICSLSLMLVSCRYEAEEKIPVGILPQEKMAEILVEKHIREAAYNLHRANESFVDYGDSASISAILVNKNVRKDDFETSMKYFVEHPKLLNEIYDEVINELSRKQAKSSLKK